MSNDRTAMLLNQFFYSWKGAVVLIGIVIGIAIILTLIIRFTPIKYLEEKK